MWTCSKCGAINEDMYTTCLTCGNNKSAGHFARQTPPAESPDPYYQPKPPAAPPAAPAPESAPRPHGALAARWLRLCGSLLAVLLPLAAACLFVFRRNTFMPQVLAWFTDRPEAVAVWLRWVIYTPVCLAGCLLCSLPGASAVVLSALLERFPRVIRKQ